MCMWVWHCHQFIFVTFFFLLLNLTIFAAQVVRQGMFDGKHIVGGIAFYKHIVYIFVLFVKQLFLMQMVDPDQIHILKCLFCLLMSMFCEFFYAPIFRSDSCRNCITSLLKRVLLLTGHDDGLVFYVPFKLCWKGHKTPNHHHEQGPVVQSVVSLTSSLRVISLTVLADSIYNILIFFAEKMWVAFALQKLLTFFQQKISAYLRITRLKF